MFRSLMRTPLIQMQKGITPFVILTQLPHKMTRSDSEKWQSSFRHHFYGQFLSHKNKNRPVFIKTSLALSFMGAGRVFVTRRVGRGSRSKYKNAILNKKKTFTTRFAFRTLTIKSKRFPRTATHARIFILCDKSIYFLDCEITYARVYEHIFYKKIKLSYFLA